jgi:hypothetical protein
MAELDSLGVTDFSTGKITKITRLFTLRSFGAGIVLYSQMRCQIATSLIRCFSAMSISQFFSGTSPGRGKLRGLWLMSVFHTVFQVHNFFDSAWRFPTLKQTSCKIRTALMRPFPADRPGKSPSPERQRLKWGMLVAISSGLLLLLDFQQGEPPAKIHNGHGRCLRFIPLAISEVGVETVFGLVQLMQKSFFFAHICSPLAIASCVK